MEIYSLGSPKTLTQFLYQRLSLSFFGDVGEELSENTHTHTVSQQSSQNSKVVNCTLKNFSNKSRFDPSLPSPAQHGQIHCGQRLLGLYMY